ncbi:hypothetical protein D3C72_2439530 [compost metagenome]
MLKYVDQIMVLNAGSVALLGTRDKVMTSLAQRRAAGGSEGPDMALAGAAE